MTTDSTVSRQWASRPSDERFTSLHTLAAKVSHDRQISRAKVVSSRAISFRPAPDDAVKGIEVVGPSGAAYAPTHWAFGQLAQRAKAPAGYLRTLPAPIAADALNYGLKFGRDVEEVGLYLRKGMGPGSVQAATGPNYGRIYNADIADALVKRFGNGVDGDWRVPGEWGRKVAVTQENTTLFASDRDMFVFLADETNRVTLPNRRDGKSGTLARGFAVSNSEVGASLLRIQLWLFDYACANRILWGVADVKTISIRHTSGAPDRWLEQALPAIDAMHTAAAGPIEATLKAAQAQRVETDLDAFLKARRFTTPEITGMKLAFTADEGRPLGDEPSLWDITTAATAYARQIPWQDERCDLERRAGSLLDLVAV